jgi:hypothetical protein
LKDQTITPFPENNRTVKNHIYVTYCYWFLTGFCTGLTQFFAKGATDLQPMDNEKNWLER